MAIPANMYNESVRERDLDHFLMEELYASPDFRAWFAGHLGDRFEQPGQAVPRTKRSPAHVRDGRQTDVSLDYTDAQGTLISCILIEGKIVDGFRPNQAKDYARRTAILRDTLGENRAACILVAPMNNHRLGAERKYFDAFIAIDDMADFVRARCNSLANGELHDRLFIRCELLEALAGKRPNSQWIAQPVAEKARLAARYDETVQSKLAGYTVNPTTAGLRAGDRFFIKFPGRERYRGSVLLKHRVYQTLVCLDFRRSPFLRRVLPKLSLPQDGSIILSWTGRAHDTLQVQIAAPQLNDKSSFAEIERSLVKVKYLANWFSENVETLNEALATP